VGFLFAIGTFTRPVASDSEKTPITRYEKTMRVHCCGLISSRSGARRRDRALVSRCDSDACTVGRSSRRASRRPRAVAGVVCLGRRCCCVLEITVGTNAAQGILDRDDRFDPGTDYCRRNRAVSICLSVRKSCCLIRVGFWKSHTAQA